MRKSHFKIGIVVLFNIAISGKISASTLSKELNDFFDATGYAHQSTDPSVYHDQQRGYYSGGSLIARRQVRHVQLAQIQFPNISAGCNGIDLFTGSFSMLNGKELERVATDIMSSTGAYAWSIALEAMSPIAAGVLEKLHSRMDLINQFGLNTCATSAALVGGIWPKMQSTQARLCQDIGTQERNIFSDWADARQGCGVRGQMQDTLSKAPQNKGYEERKIDGNVVWKALSRASFSNDSIVMKELLMTLAGTAVISIQHDDTVSKKIYPSLVTQENTVYKLLHGGNVRVYHCNDTPHVSGCLKITEMDVLLDKNESLVEKVSHEIETITQAIASDTRLTDKQIQFLNSTPIPIAKIITVNLVHHPHQTIVDLRQFSEIIALNIVVAFLNECIGLVDTSMQGLPVDSELFKEYYEGIQHAKNALREEEKRLGDSVSLLNNILAGTRDKEKLLSGKLTTQFDTIMH